MTARDFRTDSHARSDPGSVREANEDSFAALPQSGIWAVADGMGGHEQGEWASAAIVRTIEDAAQGDGFDAVLASCADAIHAANRIVCAEAGRMNIRMGSTVAALVIRDRRFGVVWAGDSRAYLMREGTLYQLTRDHTQVQEMLDRGLISPQDAVDHPMSHVLARAIGVTDELELDAIADDACADDLFLLCSDGLYGTLPDDELAEILRAVPVGEIADTLIARCLKKGANDNVTVIVVQAQEPTLLIRTPELGLVNP